MIKLGNTVPSVYPSIIQSPSLPKTSSRERIFQKGEYPDFNGHDTMSILVSRIFITKWDYDFLIDRKFTKKHHVLEVRKCITINHELHMKLFFTVIISTVWGRPSFSVREGR